MLTRSNRTIIYEEVQIWRTNTDEVQLWNMEGLLVKAHNDSLKDILGLEYKYDEILPSKDNLKKIIKYYVDQKYNY